MTSSQSMDLSGPTAKRARVGLGESTLPAPRALQKDSSTLLQAPHSNGLQVGKGKPKNKAEKKNAWAWEQFAEVVVGSSVQQVQEDSDDEEGQDEQQQVESVPSQQQGQQDKVKWCCKHCQKVLSGRNEDRMKKHLLNPRVCKFLDSSAAADCTAKEVQDLLSSRGSSSAATPHAQSGLKVNRMFKVCVCMCVCVCVCV